MTTGPITWQERLNQAPDIPDDTCPVIDRIQTRLSGIDSDLSIVRAHIQGSRWKCKDDLGDDIRGIEETLAGVRLLFEELRKDNEALRNSGRYWYGQAKILAFTQKGS